MLKKSWDERRDLLIGKSKEEAIDLAVDHFIGIAKKAIQERGRFSVALSGGSTPKAIYQTLSRQKKHSLDWGKVLFFFSDERSVPLDHPDSNYHMAMEAGLKYLPIPKSHIFRMKAEQDIHTHAKAYEHLIDKHLGADLFDLVMLGVGEDGHTASLFPGTKALEERGHAVCANYIPQKKIWRMTLTFDCINNSSHIVLYVLGKEKKDIVRRILSPPSNCAPLPAERIGTNNNKSLWIIDLDSFLLLQNSYGT